MVTTMRGMIDVAAGNVTPSLYESDDHTWLIEQVAALRDGRLEDLDRENMIEFLTEMAGRDKDALESAFIVLLHHLLKVQAQPEKMTRSWALTIVEQQDTATRLLEKKPGLMNYRDALYAAAYPLAIRRAVAETGLPVAQFPVSNPWMVDEAIAFVPPAPPVHPSSPRRSKH